MRSNIMRSGVALAAFAGVTAATAGVGSLISPRPSSPATQQWFQRLRKPRFQPPAAVFGPVWSVLYTTIAISGFRTWRAPRSPARSRALRWWAIQLALNGAWSPLFFGRKNPRAALADSALLWASAANYTRLASHVDKSAAWILAPYLGWLTFATALNAAIVRKNDPAPDADPACGEHDPP
jgi:benzodiazapine receptor